MIYSKTGSIAAIDGREVVVVERGDAGNVLYGPYVHLGRGRYVVTFHVAVDGDVQSVSEVPCILLDVATDQGTRMVRKLVLSAAEIAAREGRITLSFTAHDEGIFEFRIFSTGVCGLRVDVDRPVESLGSGKLPLNLPPSHPARRLYEDNLGIFQSLERRGAMIAAKAPGGLIVTFNDLQQTIINSEDVQVIDEIYLHNSYNLQTARDKLVIDIGMNVGLVSLYFAGMASVRAVMAFEPFGVPFGRAQEAFAANPAQAAKITPHHFGLGRADEEREVLISPDETVGTSVRGVSEGRAERIRIVDAATAIAPLAARAAAEGLDLVVKMDCEGSEFDIFDRLVETDLLKAITVMVIEWHKWWSPQRTVGDLTRPLLAAGFAVHDHTHSDDPYAGMLYAVRMAR